MFGHFTDNDLGFRLVQYTAFQGSGSLGLLMIEVGISNLSTAILGN